MNRRPKRVFLLLFQSFFAALAAFLIAAVPGFSSAGDNHAPPQQLHRLLQSASELDYPPFAIVREDGSADGFSVDLLKSVVKAAGLQIVFSVGPWPEIKNKLIRGELDVLPFVSYSAERDQFMDFSAPYLRMYGTIFVRKGETSIRHEADLKGKEVLVMKGDTAHEYAVQKKLSDRLILTDTFGDAMKLLSSGKHDAVIIQQLAGLQLIRELNISNVVNVTSLPEFNIKPNERPLSGFEQKFCFAVPEGNKELLARLNEGLAIVITNGTYNELYDRWFSPVLPEPPVPISLLMKYLISILLPVLCLAGFWGIWYFRREVARKTAMLRKEIQARKKTEEDLQKSENRFRDISYSMADWIWEIDPEGNYTYVSDTVKNILGYAAEELIGKSPSVLMPPEEGAKIKQLFLKNSAAAKPVVDLENWNLTRNGTRVCLLTNGVPILDANGMPQGYRGVNKDITKQKKLELEKETLEMQLQQTWRMETIGTLAGGIAHDFNNLLYPIIGFTEMMLDDAPEGSSLRENLEEVLTASVRASELVQQLLTFSRQMEGERKPLKLQLMLKELLKLIQISLPSNIDLKPSIDIRCRKVVADPMHIHQIVTNLITNACHAMEETGGILTIGLSEDTITAEESTSFPLNPGTYVCFSVSDTGHGMEEHVLDRIFEPYFTTKTEGRGAGLGLSVVHGIVKSYNGDIRVSSKSGKGSVFKVYLPALDPEQEDSMLMEDQAAVRGGHEHILLVDDEEPILKMGKRMLESFGYQISTQKNSITALEEFRAASEKFDLVITDMTMPGMNGDRLAMELKQIRNDIPVIVCTGFSETISGEKAAPHGFDSLLMKPVVKQELLQTIRTLLDTPKKG